MNSVLCVYDIPQNLKIRNPSVLFRRSGVRVNLSAWIFPQGCVPTETIETLRTEGATVHLVEFSEQAQDKVLSLARDEVRRHARKVSDYVRDRCGKIRTSIAVLQAAQPILDIEKTVERQYRKWRGILSRARRELIAAEQCALGFGITRDVQEATDGLKNLLSAELGMALQCISQNSPVVFQPSVAV
jgi:hypothetical protein